MGWIWPGLMVGSAVGAVLAVWIGNLNTEALKYYLPIVTAFLGAGIAVINTRYMDARADRRTQERKLRFVAWSLSRAEGAAQGLLNDMEKLLRKGQFGKTADEYREMEPQVGGAASSMLLLALACAEMPAFDEIVETHDDVVQAHNASIAFRYFELMCNQGEGDRLELLAEYARMDPDLGVLRDYTANLRAAADHFRARAPWASKHEGSK